MVKLNRIYTKTGDSGITGLGNGARVSKTDPRVESYGEVDEANAALGLCVAAAQAEIAGSPGATLGELLASIRHDLFDVGADLCCPIEPGEAPHSRLRVSSAQTLRLEREIDRWNHDLPPLTSFVLPGGSGLAAHLHLARTVVRRAERRVVALLSSETARTNAEVLRYLNRLSDLLFVLSRVANGGGAGDVLWIPGANRTK
ncbi:MAG: cob(I)yrinic acid a,c-diamide adenosyltransferase [Phycisphaerae bacterium]|nr:cob(I)yrinic acid a,c-diamide adenosyltransferase [Phycisphaerae bacterium]